MSDQFSNSNIAIAPFPAFLWSQSAGAGAGKDPDWFHHAPIITVHVYTCLLVTRYTCLLVTSHTCHLYLLQLVLDDALLVPDGGLQVLVPLEQRVAQLGRQLQVCNMAQESGYDCNVLVHNVDGEGQVWGEEVCGNTKEL